MPKVLVIHGAGMNMRGKAQIEVFGPMKLPEYDKQINWAWLAMFSKRGNGFTCGEFLRRGYDVVGIDLSEQGIAIARNAHPQVRFRTGFQGRDFSFEHRGCRHQQVLRRA